MTFNETMTDLMLAMLDLNDAASDSDTDELCDDILTSLSQLTDAERADLEPRIARLTAHIIA